MRSTRGDVAAARDINPYSLGRSWFTIDPELWALPMVRDRENDHDIVKNLIHQCVRESGDDLSPNGTSNQRGGFGELK